MAAADLIEHADRWELPVAGRAVDRICIDYQFRLHLFYEADELGSEPSMDRPVEIVVGGSFIYVSPAGSTHHLDEPASFGPALELFGMTVREVSFAKEDGRLTLRFQEGARLEVPAMEEYEAWEIEGLGRNIYCLPGGDIAWVGGPGSKRYVVDPDEETS